VLKVVKSSVIDAECTETGHLKMGAVSSHRRNGHDGAIGRSRIEEADQWGVEKRSKVSI
jgi:exopolyphosphatase/pppGpp-phosphohydrolase